MATAKHYQGVACPSSVTTVNTEMRPWIVGLAIAVAAGAAVVLLGRRGRIDRRRAAPRKDVVDTASDDSFPASDPPSWTATHA